MHRARRRWRFGMGQANPSSIATPAAIGRWCVNRARGVCLAAVPSVLRSQRPSEVGGAGRKSPGSVRLRVHCNPSLLPGKMVSSFGRRRAGREALGGAGGGGWITVRDLRAAAACGHAPATGEHREPAAPLRMRAGREGGAPGGSARALSLRPMRAHRRTGPRRKVAENLPRVPGNGAHFVNAELADSTSNRLLGYPAATTGKEDRR